MLYTRCRRILKTHALFHDLNRWKLGISSKPYRFIAEQGNMSKFKVLITRPDVPKPGCDLLREKCDVIFGDKPVPIPRSELLSKIKGVDALFCLLSDQIDEEVIEAAGPRLKVVATMSVGVDHLDLQALKKRNIKVGYTPGILTDATTELTIGLLLATSRRLIEANRAIYKSEWKAWGPTWMCGKGLAGSTIGIVGLGRIGLRVAECLHGFNVKRILYTSRKEKTEAAKIGGEKVDLDELLDKSDFVIVTVASTAETRGMFTAEKFQKMKRTSIFINVSRGDVVDQDALIEALKNGTIAAAGLDVTAPEPLPLNSELLKLDNCVVLPHIGSACTETREKMSAITAKNILAVLNGNVTMPYPYPQ